MNSYLHEFIPKQSIYNQVVSIIKKWLLCGSIFIKKGVKISTFQILVKILFQDDCYGASLYILRFY